MENYTFDDFLIYKDYHVKGDLPDLFLSDCGSRIENSCEWNSRRNEIIKTAINLQFGEFPPSPKKISYDLLHEGKRQRSYKIRCTEENRTLSILVTILLPKGDSRPFIVSGDMCAEYYMKDNFISSALDNDIGWVLFNRTELSHDLKDQKTATGSVHDLFPNKEISTISAWAWGYMRCLDLLEKIALPQIDMGCIAVTGHSRGGKAAILAGAMDERIAIVNPNEACLGGGGCYRLYMKGDYQNLSTWPTETLEDILSQSPHWFSKNMELFIGKENELPFDTHSIKALIAPRVLFVSEAAGDVWANPIGSWMTTMAAQKVYDFLGASDNLYWYFRPGTHYHKKQDVDMLVNVICHVHDGCELNESFFKTPFKQPELIFDWDAPQCKQEEK